MKLNPGDKVKFKDSYDGCFKEFKNKTLTVLWFHPEVECGEPEGRIKIKEIQDIDYYHLINPNWIEKIK